MEKPLDQQGTAETSLETAEYYSQATGPTAYISCPRGKGLVIPDSHVQRGRELRQAARVAGGGAAGTEVGQAPGPHRDGTRAGLGGGAAETCPLCPDSCGQERTDPGDTNPPCPDPRRSSQASIGIPPGSDPLYHDPPTVTPCLGVTPHREPMPWSDM